MCSVHIALASSPNHVWKASDEEPERETYGTENFKSMSREWVPLKQNWSCGRMQELALNIWLTRKNQTMAVKNYQTSEPTLSADLGDRLLDLQAERGRRFVSIPRNTCTKDRAVENVVALKPPSADVTSLETNKCNTLTRGGGGMMILKKTSGQHSRRDSPRKG